MPIFTHAPTHAPTHPHTHTCMHECVCISPIILTMLIFKDHIAIYWHLWHLCPAGVQNWLKSRIHGFTSFHEKSGPVTFHHLSMSNSVQKIRKILRAVLLEKWLPPNQLTTPEYTHLKVRITIPGIYSPKEENQRDRFYGTIRHYLAEVQKSSARQ